jgi:hypothetical protein
VKNSLNASDFDRRIAALLDAIARSPTLKPPDLPIAGWVPEPIARHFRERYYANLDVVTRLVSHERMRFFYEVMFGKSGDAYEYPARIEGENEESRQIVAVIRLLDMVVRIAKTAITPLKKAEAKQRYEKSIATSRLLLEDMDDPWLDSELLHNAARVYQEQGLARYRHEMRFATKNKSAHSRNRALVIQIANKIQKLFGETLHGTVANLATAATGRKITRSTDPSGVRHLADPGYHIAAILLTERKQDVIDR